MPGTLKVLHKKREREGQGGWWEAGGGRQKPKQKGTQGRKSKPKRHSKEATINQRIRVLEIKCLEETIKEKSNVVGTKETTNHWGSKVLKKKDHAEQPKETTISQRSKGLRDKRVVAAKSTGKPK